MESSMWLAYLSSFPSVQLTRSDKKALRGPMESPAWLNGLSNRGSRTRTNGTQMIMELTGMIQMKHWSRSNQAHIRRYHGHDKSILQDGLYGAIHIRSVQVPSVYSCNICWYFKQTISKPTESIFHDLQWPQWPRGNGKGRARYWAGGLIGLGSFDIRRVHANHGGYRLRYFVRTTLYIVNFQCWRKTVARIASSSTGRDLYFARVPRNWLPSSQHKSRMSSTRHWPTRGKLFLLQLDANCILTYSDAYHSLPNYKETGSTIPRNFLPGWILAAKRVTVYKPNFRWMHRRSGQVSAS